jgi:hypothetical protein
LSKRRPELRASGAGAGLFLGLPAPFEDDHEMLRHGIVMYDALHAWLKQARAEPHGRPPQNQPRADAEVDEASWQSFPASDPPSFTPICGVGRPDSNRAQTG